ncbi:hypothetical protein COU57_04875 [Candidatus Pacearchaeota archaeon CG10_big_fil_rev_8_21_14_0_10_32_14]|nr:MAG: hypothetical protein COU57_04875 [Candidatus Pacearchaeota archaeon CG10_big_fil_rev_8_21_14_0_10_32_14]
MRKAKKESGLSDVYKFILIIFLIFFIGFFLNESYNIGLIAPAAISIFAGISFFYQWKKSFFNFILFFLTAVFIFIAIEISFNFLIYIPLISSIVCAYAVSYIYDKSPKDKTYNLLLLVVFIVLWIILAFNVSYRDDWVMENVINVPFVILLIVISRWFKFSKLSYSLIFLFMLLNIIGSHYTYAEVPFGFWLQDYFNQSRNHYDRIVHFSFGLLFAYPIREIFMRIGKSKGFWALWTPIELVLGLSAIYEILEWWIAVMFGGDLGIAYLGTQGDIWDAQWDMFLAGLGSMITIFIVLAVLLIFKYKDYLKELKESFKVNKKPLGEKALEKIQRRKR